MNKAQTELLARFLSDMAKLIFGGIILKPIVTAEPFHLIPFAFGIYAVVFLHIVACALLEDGT